MKRPKLPRTIQVLTRTYQVRYNDKMAAWGLCSYAEGLLEINGEKCGNANQIMRTFWHEVGHAFAWESGLASFMASSTEEMFVENYSALMVQHWGLKLPGGPK